ncbi:hypothetical protein GCM10011492_36490 [Flexivirga endophytica]|uniref:Uncharacterized protein n=1 Tax=Flexivirga endophytica TaxID=1849103 RepID=A0A916WZ78_9MICO|nr:hypothetical protein GCM10011492_36490 [Flexivirga endophytica]GHB70416.1 hypothetical protein GCM10008112_43600 [Flexivirga endophytica]
MLVMVKVTGPAGADAWSSSQPPALVNVTPTCAAPPDTFAAALLAELPPDALFADPPEDDDPQAVSARATATAAPGTAARRTVDLGMC